jgi:hypothetical protein
MPFTTFHSEEQECQGCITLKESLRHSREIVEVWSELIDRQEEEIAKLKTRVASLEANLRAFEMANGQCHRQRDALKARVGEVERERDGWRRECDRQAVRIASLAEALDNLMDWQNGPPLVTYTEGWTAAMEQACAALSAPREDAHAPDCACPVCRGEEVPPGNAHARCERCGGTGYRTALCRECEQGRIETGDPCPACGGRGSK